MSKAFTIHIDVVCSCCLILLLASVNILSNLHTRMEAHLQKLRLNTELTVCCYLMSCDVQIHSNAWQPKALILPPLPQLIHHLPQQPHRRAATQPLQVEQARVPQLCPPQVAVQHQLLLQQLVILLMFCSIWGIFSKACSNLWV